MSTMRSSLLFLIVVASAVFVIADDTKPCQKGLYKIGDKCEGICGNCANGKTCFSNNGTCPATGKGSIECEPGWVGDYCKKPICNQQCGTGECIYPDVCFCGEDINRVGKDCSDIRVRGIIGSIAAFAVLTSSIALCGMGSKLYAKRREGASI